MTYPSREFPRSSLETSFPTIPLTFLLPEIIIASIIGEINTQIFITLEGVYMKESKFFPISSDASFSDRLTAICNYRNIQTDAELARIICRHKEETNDPNVN